jgi:hypothetical protein
VVAEIVEGITIAAGHKTAATDLPVRRESEKKAVHREANVVRVLNAVNKGPARSVKSASNALSKDRREKETLPEATVHKKN